MKSHRGLSAVVGTVFLIAVVIGALSYISYSIDVMGNFSEQIIAEETRQKETQDEKFELLTVDTVTNKLDATIKNTGEIPLTITTMYLDEMGANDIVQKINIDQTISPGNTFDFFSEGIDVDIDSTKGYSMKLISNRGESQTFYLNSASQEPLDIRLIATPERVPTGFSTTLMMVVVNNMSNNNPLVNLVPIEPACSGICTKLSGPIPASYDTLDHGDVAIFRWSYELDGENEQSVTFRGELQNGYANNYVDETVTITTIKVSELAGQSISSLGFGQSEQAPDLFLLHTEDYGIPGSADYQMSTSVPDGGTTLVLDDTGDQYQWFSANVTTDTTLFAGVWNASLRYNHDRLSSGMAAGASDIHDNANDGGGHTLHFNTDATLARKDSGQMSGCTDLVDGGTLNGATWGANIGVNGSGAYLFDGDDDYISILNSGSKKDCNYGDNQQISIAGWFNSTNTSTDATQTIFSKSDPDGGYTVAIGDGSAGKHGWVLFQFKDEGGDTMDCWAENDYSDNNWHHFVGVMTSATACELYVDGVSEDTDSNGSVGHEHGDTEALYIGAKDGTTEEFYGVIDDIMYWNNYMLTADDVTALFGYSYGEDITSLNFYISNATGAGVTDDVIASDLSYSMPWGDQMASGSGLWTGGNWTTGSIPEVVLSGASTARLNFTIGYASGEALNLRIDDENLDGSTGFLSSYLQVPGFDPELPVFHTHDRDNKVTFFALNGIGEGVWLTYQGTRIVFNGTQGHYTGIVDTVDNGVTKVTLSADTDSGFIDSEIEADIVYWHPQNAPAASQPGEPEKMPEGDYEVYIYLNGYDEDGTVFIRSIGLGSVQVVE